MNEPSKLYGNVWVYSASSSGELRAVWRLTEKELARYGDLEATDETLENQAVAAIEQLKASGAGKGELPDVRGDLALYAATSDAWAATGPPDWELGMHFVVIDYALPGDNLMLTTFSVPHSAQLSEEQVAHLVGTVVSGHGCSQPG
jgi:hypothetical protein